MKKMVLMILATPFFFAPTLVSAQSFEFPVELQRTLKNSRGTLIITPEQIEYKATEPKDSKDSRTWRYVDIRQIKVAAPTILEIATYEDAKRLLGRDRVFTFRLLEGEVTPEISALLMEKATRPVVTSVMPATEGEPVFEIPVKHLHTLGGCEGVLRIYPDRVTYESTTKPSDSRYWRYADIQSFGWPTRFRFEITTYENKTGGPTRTFNFELKEDFPALAYDYLWLRTNPSGFYPYDERVPPPEGPLMPSRRPVVQ
ncbi:MAG: hypothetical protein HY314_07550 [Acidobacteria bacterium]|nr:hypothetical protein [Acidobacteriota bacterium]